VLEEKQLLDVVGHYGRPEVFKLTVDRRPFFPFESVGESVDVEQELSRLQALAKEARARPGAGHTEAAQKAARVTRMDYSELFEPGLIGNMSVKNRLVMAPMGLVGMEMVEPNGAPTQRAVDYYEERARGGVGMIITSFTFVTTTLDRPGLMAGTSHSFTSIPRPRCPAGSSLYSGRMIMTARCAYSLPRAWGG